MAPQHRNIEPPPALSKRWVWISSVVTGLLSVAILLWTATPAAPPSLRPIVRGRNNTVLFLTNEVPGLSNVHLATAAALIEHHPDLQVHYAAVPASSMDERLARASELALDARLSSGGSMPEAGTGGIVFHPFYSAGSLTAASPELYWALMQPPGLAGVSHITRLMKQALVPWTGPEYLALYHECVALIEQIDPAVVVLDTLFHPGREATRRLNRTHAFVSPNLVVSSFASMQPWGGALWKYPV
jgi:hypothetical protein